MIDGATPPGRSGQERPSTGLEGVIVGAGGVRIARRGWAAPDDGALRVEGIAAVVPPRTPPTEARTRDGIVWRRQWFEHRRLVIEFVGVCLAEVEADGRIVFDRRLRSDMEEHLLLDHVLPLTLAGRGELVLHGGLISLGGRGVLLTGMSGAGKSTLTAHAWNRGWDVAGDDGAVVSLGDPPRVESTYGSIRLPPASAELLGLGPEASSPIVGKVRLMESGRRRFHRGPVELSLVANIEPSEGGEARFEPLRGVDSHALLFGSTFHAELTGHRLLPVIVERLAAIVEVTTVGRLVVPRGLDGLSAAEGLLRSRLGSRREEAPSTGIARRTAVEGV